MKRRWVFVAILLMGFTSYVQGNLDKLLEETKNTQRQFLKSIIENELPTLIIKRPNIENLIQKAEQGDAKAQYELGEIYARGSWLPKSEGQTTRWWLKSAKQGYTEASQMLYMYVHSKLSNIQNNINIQNEVSWERKLPEKKSKKIHDTLQMLAAYNEKAFIPKYKNSTYDSEDKIDRLDSSRFSANYDFSAVIRAC